MSEREPPELKTAVDLHKKLKTIEEQTRKVRFELGEALTAARNAGISQKQLTETLGENRETLRRWERAAAEEAVRRAAS